jgi:ATP-binding cassette subfamily B protein
VGGQRALADLRIRIFTHLQSLPIGFYESRPAGVLISRMTNDVEALESLVTDSVVTLFQAGLTLIGAVAVLLYLDPALALLTFCVVPLVVGASIWFRLISASAFRRTRGRRSGRSRPTCRRPCRESGSCAASARSRCTRRGSPS